MAAMIAFLLGVPLSEKAVAGVGDVITGSLQLGLGIADLADTS